MFLQKYFHYYRKYQMNQRCLALSLPTLVTVVSPKIDVSSARPYVTSSGMKRHSASANCQSLSSVTDTCTDAVDPAGLWTMSAWAGTPNKAHTHAATHAKAAVAVR